MVACIFTTSALIARKIIFVLDNEELLQEKSNLNSMVRIALNRLFADHFKQFLESINIKGSVVNCRHTFATNCFYLEKPELIISREMGHTSSQITKDNYISIDYNLSKEKIINLYGNLYNLD